MVYLEFMQQQETRRIILSNLVTKIGHDIEDRWQPITLGVQRYLSSSGLQRNCNQKNHFRIIFNTITPIEATQRHLLPPDHASANRPIDLEKRNGRHKHPIEQKNQYFFTKNLHG